MRSALCNEVLDFLCFVVLDEISQRLEFLDEMNRMGKKKAAASGVNYQDIIKQEIAAKLKELKSYDSAW